MAPKTKYPARQPKAKAKSKAMAKTKAIKPKPSESVRGRGPKRFHAFAASVLGQSFDDIFPEAQDRRRIIGKQPPKILVALQGPFSGYSGPTFTKKSQSRATLHPRGHYDELQVLRGASAVEIREAFRRRALLTHPDKGGRPEEFHGVVAAFEILSDGSRRAAYDQELQESGNFDGLSEVGRPMPGPDEEDPTTRALAEKIETFRAMRIVLHMLLSEKLQNVNEQLKKQSSDVLRAMVQWLLCSCSRSSNTFESDGGKDGDVSKNHVLEPKLAGIYREKTGGNGYYVYMHWSTIKCRTQKTNSLTEAVDWHITLTQLKATSQARMRQAEEDCIDLMKVPPLTEEEVALAYQASPTVRLSFSCILTSGRARIVLPCTTDIGLAQKLQAQGRSTMERVRDGQLGEKKKKEFIDKLKQNATRSVNKEKFDRQLLERRLLHAVHSELSMRHQHERGPNSHNASSSTTRPTDPVVASSFEARRLWRLQAELAIELRDVLGLTHEDTKQAVHMLKTGSPDLLKAARAVIRGEVVPLMDTLSAQGKRSRGSQDDGVDLALAKRPRTSAVLLSTASILQAATINAETGSSMLVPAGRPDAVLRALQPLLDLRQRYTLRACGRAVRELVDLEARRTCRDFVYTDGLFHWAGGPAIPEEDKVALRLSSYVATHRDAIYHMDLGAAPVMALQHPQFQQAISKMRNLQDVVFPNHGWTSAAARSEFLSALPAASTAWGRNKVAGRS